MMRIKKLFLIAFISFGCMAFISSCSHEKKEDIINVSNKLDCVYQSSIIESKCPIDQIESFSSIDNNSKFVISGYTGEKKKDINSNYEIYITDINMQDFNKVSLDFQNQGKRYYDCDVLTNNDNIIVLVRFYNYDDSDEPDLHNQNISDNITNMIYLLDSSGNCLKKTDIKGIEKIIPDYSFDENIYVSLLCFFDNEKILASLDTSQGMFFLTLGIDGTVDSQINIDNFDIKSFFTRDSNDDFVFISENNKEKTLSTLSNDTMELSSNEIALNQSGINSLLTGHGEWRVFINNSDAMYGIKNDGEVEKIIDFVNSYISGSCIKEIMEIEEGLFIAREYDLRKNTSSFYKFFKCDNSRRNIINIATFNYSEELVNLVQTFNQVDPDCRVNIKDYSQYYKVDEENKVITDTPEEHILQDLVTNNNIDMICATGNSNIVNILANKDILTDLYQYFGKNGTIEKDEIISPIISAGDINGKLVSISPYCLIDTLACKSKYFSKENWTLNDLISTYSDISEDMELFMDGNSKEDVFFTLIYGSNLFVDYKNFKCNFDCDDFIKLLEFSNSFDNPDEKFHQISAGENCHNDKVLISNICIDDIRAYSSIIHKDFGEKISLVGYPSNNGEGARITTQERYCILDNSPNKEQCWKFINLMFEKEYQNSDKIPQLPALKSAFINKLDDAMTESSEDVNTNANGSDGNISPLTKEERDYLEKYILDISSDSTCYDYNISMIIYEEVLPFFNGEKTAKEVASAVQNRVSMLLGEKS